MNNDVYRHISALRNMIQLMEDTCLQRTFAYTIENLETEVRNQELEAKVKVEETRKTSFGEMYTKNKVYVIKTFRDANPGLHLSEIKRMLDRAFDPDYVPF